MIHKKPFKRWYIDLLILLAVLALYGINIYSLASVDTTPPMWDEAVHLRDSLIFYNILRDPSQVSLSVVREIINWSEQYPLIRPSGYYPPLAPTITSLLYPIFGTSALVSIMSNMIFISILVLSVYGLGTFMFNRNVGLLAGILILLSPLILKHSAIYMIDLPLTAMVAFSIYCLLKSDYFRNTTFSILFGISCGLGMLTKWTFLFFILAPLIFCILKVLLYKTPNGVKVKSLKSTRVFRNIIFPLVTALVIFGPYYFPILSILLEKTLRSSAAVGLPGPKSLLSIDSIFFYLAALWKSMITPFGFALLTIGAVVLIISKNVNNSFILTWSLVPYLIFTLMIVNKNPRVMMPWLVSICLIASFSLEEFESIKKLALWRWLKRSVVFLLIAFVMIIFLKENLLLKTSIIESSKENWKIEEIVDLIEDDINNRGLRELPKGPLYLGVIPDHYYINGQTISYYFTQRWIPINVVKLETFRGTAYQEFVAQFDKYDYIITKDSLNMTVPSFQKSINDMHNYFYSHIDLFEHMWTLQEPDGSHVSIFKRL